MELNFNKIQLPSFAALTGAPAEERQQQPLLRTPGNVTFTPNGGVAIPLTARRAAHADWSSKRVGEWLVSMSLGEYAELFDAHRISGDLLDHLTEDHLIGLGVKIIGHRLMMLRELEQLKKRSAGRERARTLWRGEEILHRTGPLGYVKEVFSCRPCCYEPARYVLTNGGITITESERTEGCLSWLCPWSHTRVTRGVDLSTVAAVTAVHSSKCWLCSCQADEVTLDDAQGKPTLLLIKSGTGDEVADLIRSTVEENLALDAGHPVTMPVNHTSVNMAMLRA